MRVKEAVIEDARIYTNNRYLVEAFSTCYNMSELAEETAGVPDMVQITAKAEDGRIAIKKFIVILKYDGTLQLDALTRRDRLRRQEFVRFLEYYNIVGEDDLKYYNVPENIDKWIGRKVGVVKSIGKYLIFIPY